MAECQSLNTQKYSLFYLQSLKKYNIQNLHLFLYFFNSIKSFRNDKKNVATTRYLYVKVKICSIPPQVSVYSI
jgi:hypothetical protein